MSHDIFISYSRRDTDRMQQVRDSLRDAGLSVWTDEGIEPGTESWKRAISDAITGCQSVIVLFSPDAAQSTWVNRELDFAELHQKKIFPLLVGGDEKSSLPFGYTTYQFIDIRRDDTLQKGLQDLISILSTMYPNRNLAITEQPAISQAENVVDAVEIASPLPSRNEETQWKLLESPQFRLFVPSTFKIMDAGHDNIARMFLLHESVPNIENMMYQFIKDEGALPQEIAVGFPGTRMDRYKTFVDITDLSVLSGSIHLLKFPLWNRDWFFGEIMMNRSLKNLKQYMQNYGASEVTRRLVRQHSYVIIILEYEVDNHTVGLYLTIPFRHKSSILFLFISEKRRFAQDQAKLETMALSTHLIP